MRSSCYKYLPIIRQDLLASSNLVKTTSELECGRGPKPTGGRLHGGEVGGCTTCGFLQNSWLLLLGSLGSSQAPKVGAAFSVLVMIGNGNHVRMKEQRMASWPDCGNVPKCLAAVAGLPHPFFECKSRE